MPGRQALCSETVIRVAYAKDAAFFTRATIDVLPHAAVTAAWKVTSTEKTVALHTAKVEARIDRATGAVAFFNAYGDAILSEGDGGRKLDAARVQGEETFHAQQQWAGHADESLYGLGQMQLGIVDIKGYDIDMWQHNTNVVVPLLVSSKGYGVFWDNTSFTRFGDLRPFVPVPAENLIDAKGEHGGLTVAPIDGSVAPKQTADLKVNFVSRESRRIIRRQISDRRGSRTRAGKVRSKRRSQENTNSRLTLTVASRCGSMASW